MTIKEKQYFNDCLSKKIIMSVLFFLFFVSFFFFFSSLLAPIKFKTRRPYSHYWNQITHQTIHPNHFHHQKLSNHRHQQLLSGLFFFFLIIQKILCQNGSYYFAITKTEENVTIFLCYNWIQKKMMVNRLTVIPFFLAAHQFTFLAFGYLNINHLFSSLIK